MASKHRLANKAHYETLAAIVTNGPRTPQEHIELGLTTAHRGGTRS